MFINWSTTAASLSIIKTYRFLFKATQVTKTALCFVSTMWGLACCWHFFSFYEVHLFSFSCRHLVKSLQFDLVHLVLTGPCCPTNLKLYRMFNHTLRVRWRSAGPQIHNHTVDLYGTGANYTCTAAAGSRYCDIQEEICGEVYSVVVSPVGRSGGTVDFCQPRTYSGGSSSTSWGFGLVLSGYSRMEIMLLYPFFFFRHSSLPRK